MNILNSFSGTIIDSSYDKSNEGKCINGSYISLIPNNIDDIKSAVSIAKLIQRELLPISGTHCLPGISFDGTDTLVLNLKRFNSIKIEDSKVIVGPAVTMEQLSYELNKSNLCLPLCGIPNKTILSDILSNSPGYFNKSLGNLTSCISSISCITIEENEKTISKDGINDFLSNISQDIITSITLSCIPIDNNLCFRRIYIPFCNNEYKNQLNSLMKFSLNDNYTSTDISISVFHGSYNAIITGITLCKLSDKKERFDDIINELIPNTNNIPLNEIIISDYYSNTISEILTILLDHGGCNSGAFHSGITNSYSKQCDNTDFINNYSDIINVLLSQNKDDLELEYPNIKISSVCHSLQNNNMNISANIYSNIHKEINEKHLLQQFEDMFTSPMISPKPKFSMMRIQPKVEKPIGVSLSLTSSIVSLGKELLFGLKEKSTERTATIKGFKGKVYFQDTPDYDTKRYQYASTSFPDDKMKPFLVCYPVDHRDISVMLKYAKKNNKKVVTRSGGHQYCGLSSGPDNTIVLSMDNFKRFDIYGNIACIGVGNVLTDLAKTFADHNITIPHGECPLVAIGGHLQTGGYGHILRNYGLCLDYCIGFDIILADGKFYSISKPTDDTDKLNNDIYWAVLGGGPGCFGVITEIVFECIKDSEHPNSGGYKGTFYYEKEVFKAAMKSVQHWTERLDPSSSNPLPDDVDLCVSAVSGDGLRFPVILVELVYGNTQGNKIKDNFFEEIDTVASKVENAQSIFRKIFPFRMKSYHGKKSLSFMSNSFVRRSGTTKDGREFKNPFVKRLNCTFKPLSNDFVDKFVDLVSETIQGEGKDKGLQLVFQMFIGGGEYRKKGQTNTNSISRRNVTHGVVFDIFHPPGKEGIENANNQQLKMKKLLKEYQGNDHEVRMFWGTFGDDLDINNVWQYYYDNEEQYKKLKDIKTLYDKDDLFSTSLSMKPNTNE